MAETRALTDDAEELAGFAAQVLRQVSDRGLSLATAESCTGGLLASLLTDIEGLSGCFERGFTTYSDEAKHEMLGLDIEAIERHGAVSSEVALAMAQGALDNSHADLAAAITGFAGPAGEGDEEGLVHLAVARAGGAPLHRECHFGRRGRDRVRLLATRAALEMLGEALQPVSKESTMSSTDERVKGFTDKIAGKAKRALGELTGRPDIVLEGEAQETLGHKETLAAKRLAEVEKRVDKA